MSKPNDLSESSLLALNIIIGRCLVSDLDLKDLQRSIPDIFGIIQSKMTKSGEFSSIPRTLVQNNQNTDGVLRKVLKKDYEL